RQQRLAQGGGVGAVVEARHQVLQPGRVRPVGDGGHGHPATDEPGHVVAVAGLGHRPAQGVRDRVRPAQGPRQVSEPVRDRRAHPVVAQVVADQVALVDQRPDEVVRGGGVELQPPRHLFDGEAGLRPDDLHELHGPPYALHEIPRCRGIPPPPRSGKPLFDHRSTSQVTSTIGNRYPRGKSSAGPYGGRMAQARLGFGYGVAAYVLWGFFPLYFKLLRPADPVEILAHRVIWSAVFVALLLVAARWLRGTHRAGTLRRLLRQPWALLGMGAGAVLIAVNWGTFIYGVNTDRVVEVSLGYFITPLFTVLLGVVVLRERLRVGQWLAVGIGAGAVAVLAIDYGRLPYVALTLTMSFGLYGL